GWMYSAAVQSNEFDGTGCPRILISLLNTPTKAISDQTRAWANGVVQRYGASKVFIRESNTSQENPALPL
ncbi:MAG TPA: hypothetical protein VGO97_00030, partial [Solirubrobacterales bacterium]|nr:hypothetical protein [Solirubrobacterales bacterium]